MTLRLRSELCGSKISLRKHSLHCKDQFLPVHHILNTKFVGRPVERFKTAEKNFQVPVYKKLTWRARLMIKSAVKMILKVSKTIAKYCELVASAHVYHLKVFARQTIAIKEFW